MLPMYDKQCAPALEPGTIWRGARVRRQYKNRIRRLVRAGRRLLGLA